MSDARVVITGAHVESGSEPTLTATRSLRATWLLGRREWLELFVAWAAFVLVGLGVSAAALRADDDNPLTRLDDRVAAWFVDRRTPTWNWWSWLGSMLADTAVKVGVTAAVVLAMLWWWRRWLEPTVVAMTLLLEAAAFITITEIAQRPRPHVPHLEGSPVDSSFPSGHTAAAAAYGAIALVTVWRARPARKRVIAAIAFGLIGLVVASVALARMYRGMHHLTDVIAGALLGAASVAAVAVIVRRAERRRASGASITP